jgi:uncharacterized ubiquitin-like protein YukD
MKIIITESQYNELKEIYSSEGTLDRFPLSDAIDIVIAIGFRKFYDFLEHYIIKHYDLNLDEIDEAKKTIKNYLEEISNQWHSKKFTTKIKNRKLKFLQDYKVISHIIYKFFKNYMNTYEFGDVKFLKYKKNNEIIYWFFDIEEKSFLGMIKGVYLRDTDASRNLINTFGKKSFVVSLSSLKPDMKGQGYGKQMYLAVLDDSGAIFSDKTLYSESKNIWIYALPKYVRTVGYIDSSDNLVKLSGDDIDVSDHKIYRFFATDRKIDI